MVKLWTPLILALIMGGTYLSGGKWLVHEVAGLTTIVLFILHMVHKRMWWSSLFKGIYNQKRKIMVISNLLFFFFLLATIITGLAGGGFIVNFKPYWGEYYRLIHHTHTILAHTTLAFFLLHLLLRLAYFKGFYKKVRS
jgi:hypothetical protein